MGGMTDRKPRRTASRSRSLPHVQCLPRRLARSGTEYVSAEERLWGSALGCELSACWLSVEVAIARNVRCLLPEGDAGAEPTALSKARAFAKPRKKRQVVGDGTQGEGRKTAFKKKIFFLMFIYF